MNKKSIKYILNDYDKFPRLYISPKDYDQLCDSVHFYSLSMHLFTPKELDEDGFVGVVELGNELWFSVFNKISLLIKKMKIKEVKKYLKLGDLDPLEKLLIDIETEFDVKFGVSFKGSKKYEYKMFVLDKIEDILLPVIRQIGEEDYIAMEENVLKAEITWNEYCIKTLEDILSNGHGGGNWRRLIISKINNLKGEKK